MLYAERIPARGGRAASLHVFSTTDSVKELHAFRCFVRAPRASLHSPPAVQRAHVKLFGKPIETATVYFTNASHLIFDTAMDRVTWELTQESVMKLHPQPFIETR